MAMRSRLSALLALFLTACGNMGNDGRGYPSLARRPIEVGGLRPAVTPPAPVVEAPTAQGEDSEVGRLAAQTRSGAAAFEAAFAAAADQARSASGAAVSSEGWVAAHVALGRLEHARSDSVLALATLDSRVAARARAAAEDKSPMDAALLAAQRDALATVDSQNDRLDALKALLKAP